MGEKIMKKSVLIKLVEGIINRKLNEGSAGDLFGLDNIKVYKTTLRSGDIGLGIKLGDSSIQLTPKEALEFIENIKSVMVREFF